MNKNGYDSELEFQVIAMTMLRLALPDDAEVWHTPNDVHTSLRKGGILKQAGVLAGFPDIAILWRPPSSQYGRLHVIELKSATGCLHASQRLLQPRLATAGAIVKPIARTLQEIEDTVIGWGIPLKFRYSDLRSRSVMTPYEQKVFSAIMSAASNIRRALAANAAKGKRNARTTVLAAAPRKNRLARR